MADDKKNKNLFSSKQFEYLFLAVFIALFLFIGFSDIMGRRMQNDIPMALLASDSYHYYNYVEGLEERGKFDYFPYYISFNLDNMIAYQPPLFFSNTAIIGNVFDTGNHNALHIIMILSLSAAILLMYFLIKRYNSNVAILSLPLSLLLFIPNFKFGILWGRQPTMWAEVFLIALFWILPKIRNYRHGLALAVIMSSLFMGHAPQILFGIVFVAVFYLVELAKNRKIPMRTIKIVVFAAVLTILLSGYYFSVFNSTVSKAQPFEFHKTTPAEEGNRYVSFWEFSYFGAFILVGLIAWLISKKRIETAFAVFMLLVGFTNYFMGSRSIETRFMWPVFLMALFGMSIYMILGFVKLRNRMVCYALAILFVILFLTTIYTPGVGRTTISPPPMWDIIKSFQEVPTHSEVLFLYGDYFDQRALILSSKQLAYSFSYSRLDAMLESGLIPRNAVANLNGESQSRIAYRRADGSVGFYADETNFDIERDLCSFDYYAAAKFGAPQRQRYLAINSALMNTLLQSPSIEVFLDNEYALVLKNNDKSADCIPVEGIVLA